MSRSKHGPMRPRPATTSRNSSVAAAHAPDGEPGHREYIPRRIALPHFASARSVRNALDRARLRQASRLVAATGRAVSRDDLATITAADLRASRVFNA